MKAARLWIACSCVLLISVQLQANPRLDSLLRRYETQPRDTQRLHLLNELVNAYLYNQPPKAKAFAEEGLSLSRELPHRKSEALFAYQLGLVHGQESDSGMYFLQQAETIALETQDLERLSSVKYAYALAVFDRGNLDSAEVLMKEVIALDEKRGDSLSIALNHGFLGSLARNRGDLEEALRWMLLSLEELEILGKKNRIADAYNVIAAINYGMKHHEEAIAYNQKAIALYEELNDVAYMSQALNDMGAQYVSLGKMEEALDAYHKALAAAREVNWTAVISTVLANLGNHYTTMGKPAEGMPYLFEAEELAASLNAQRRRAIAQSLIGNAYNEMGRGNQAVPYLDDAIAEFRSSNSRSHLGMALKRRSEAFSLVGNYQKALADQIEVGALRDSLLNEEKIEQIERMRVEFQTEQKEAALALQISENARLEQETRAQRLQIGLYGTGMLALMGCSLAVFLALQSRNRRNRLAHEKQEAIFQAELAFKRRELASQTLHLVHKNTYMEEVDGILQEVKENPETFSQAHRRIKGLMNIESESEKGWEAYKAYFAEVYHDFDQRFQEDFGEMSETELKLASLMKMKLSSKEIAAILHVQPESIRKARYRLKKKLGLGKETDLATFLSNY